MPGPPECGEAVARVTPRRPGRHLHSLEKLIYFGRSSRFCPPHHAMSEERGGALHGEGGRESAGSHC